MILFWWKQARLYQFYSGDKEAKSRKSTLNCGGNIMYES